jgi:hypothetical protein
MNTNEFRHFDHDAIRERAHALRRQAISDMFDAVAAWAVKLVARVGNRAQAAGRRSAPCAADC